MSLPSQPKCFPFQRLPSELRAKILLEAFSPFPSPRVIEAHLQIDPTSPFDRHDNDSRGRFPTRSRFARFYDPDATDPPGLSLMWAWGESRDFAMTYYSFTCEDIPNPQTSTAYSNSGNERTKRVPQLKNPGILFNPNKDIIFLRSRHGISALSYARSSELNLANIKVIALDIYLWRHYLISRQLFEGWKEDAPFLTGLETLILVLDDDYDVAYERDARSVGNQAAVEKLKQVVRSRLESLSGLKKDIRVLVISGNHLTSLSPDVILGDRFD